MGDTLHSAAAPDRAQLRRVLAEVKRKAQPLLDPLTGIVYHVETLPVFPGDPPYFVQGGRAAATNRLYPHVITRHEEGGVPAGGTSLYAEQAELRTLCEAIERYCGFVCDPAQWLLATARDLGSAALDLTRLAALSPAETAHPQANATALDLDAPRYWARGLSLHDGRHVYIPISLLWIGLNKKYAGAEADIAPMISTGSAIGGTLEQALVSGACEAIERDALTIAWLCQLPLPRITFDSDQALPFSLSERLRRIAQTDVELYLFDATTDIGIPTVYCLEIARHGAVAGVVSCATDFDPVRAITKAIDEVGASRQVMSFVQRWRDVDRSDPRNIRSLEAGALYYVTPETLPAFDFLIHSPNRRSVTEMVKPDTGSDTTNLASVIAHFESVGLEAFAVDLTPREVRDAGFWTVKVIVPGLQPLSTDYNRRYLANPRLYEVSERLGYGRRTEADVTRWPNPFN